MYCIASHIGSISIIIQIYQLAHTLLAEVS